MRRPIEDSIQTKEDILDAAFDCFYENGFEATSLEAIAKRANVTRGAVYWHFTNKKELYKNVVERTLSRADVVSVCAHQLDVNLPYQKRIHEVFWFAVEDRREMDFIYKSINLASQKEEFKDVLEKIQYEKIKLFRYFVEETSLYLRENHKVGIEAEDYASALFLLFEGLFLTKNISVGVQIDRKSVEIYVDLVIREIIASENSENQHAQIFT